MPFSRPDRSAWHPMPRGFTVLFIAGLLIAIAAGAEWLPAMDDRDLGEGVFACRACVELTGALLDDVLPSLRARHAGILAFSSVAETTPSRPGAGRGPAVSTPPTDDRSAREARVGLVVDLHDAVRGLCDRLRAAERAEAREAMLRLRRGVRAACPRTLEGLHDALLNASLRLLLSEGGGKPKEAGAVEAEAEALRALPPRGLCAAQGLCELHHFNAWRNLESRRWRSKGKGRGRALVEVVDFTRRVWQGVVSRPLAWISGLGVDREAVWSLLPEILLSIAAGVLTSFGFLWFLGSGGSSSSRVTKVQEEGLGVKKASYSPVASKAANLESENEK